MTTILDGQVLAHKIRNEVKKEVEMLKGHGIEVGPVTISMLLENTLTSARRNEFYKSPNITG